MRAVAERVKRARVTVEGRITGEIGPGLLIYAGVEKGDSRADIEYMAAKVSSMRLFEDAEGKMNLDLRESGGAVLVVSQFTLLGDLRKGRRPSFDRAEEPGAAKSLYEAFMERLKSEGIRVEKGEFRAHMEVESVNDGPVTVMLDSRRLF